MQYNSSDEINIIQQQLFRDNEKRQQQLFQDNEKRHQQWLQDNEKWLQDNETYFQKMKQKQQESHIKICIIS